MKRLQSVIQDLTKDKDEWIAIVKNNEQRRDDKTKLLEDKLKKETQNREEIEKKN